MAGKVLNAMLVEALRLTANQTIVRTKAEMNEARAMIC